MTSSFQTRCCRVLVAVFAAVGLGVAPTPVVAGPLIDSGTSYNDGSGPAGGAWEATYNHSKSIPFLGQELTASVDMAVFTGADFNTLTGTSVTPTDVNPTDYVYAYQIDVNSLTGTSWANFSVGIHDNPSRSGPFSVSLDSADIEPSGLVENLGSGGTGTMVWEFGNSSPALASGTRSQVLYFTSTGNPEYDSMQALVGSAGFGSIPAFSASNPEPSSVCLMLIAAAGLGVQRVRRRGCR